jgi:hypothetical protein
MISLLPHSFYLQRKKKLSPEKEEIIIVATMKNWQKAKISCSFQRVNNVLFSACSLVDIPTTAKSFRAY